MAAEASSPAPATAAIRQRIAATRPTPHAVIAGVCVALTVGARCAAPPEPSPPVEVSLQIVTRASCGAPSGLDYDATCTAAVFVRARNAARAPVFEACRRLEDRPADLRALLDGAPIVTFDTLNTDDVVTFEVRGLHDASVDARDPCDAPDDNARWLFWGASAPEDLSRFRGDEATSLLIPVVVECRDCAEDCADGDGSCFGCFALGTASCPATFPASFCAPSLGNRCARPCEEDDDCFEGARRCVDGVCETDDVTGALCSPCGVEGPPCAEGFQCIGAPQAEVGFCAPPCPDTLCPAGTRCTRAGNGIARVVFP